MLSTEKLKLTLAQALYHYRNALATNENERRSDLPRKGKMPATESDDFIQEEFRVQLEAINRFLDCVDDMVSAVVKPPESQISRVRTPIPENLDPFIDPYNFQNDEPFINPFSGLLVEPVTLFTPGPSTREGPLREIPANGLGMEVVDHSFQHVPTSALQQTPQTSNPSLPVLRGGDIKPSNQHYRELPVTENGKAPNITTVDAVDSHPLQPASTTTSPLPAASGFLKAAIPFAWKSWIPGTHADGRGSEGSDPNVPSRPELVAGIAVPGPGPPAPAPAHANEIQATPVQSLPKSNLPIPKEAEEFVDSFFPRNPRAKTKAPGQHHTRGRKPQQRSRTVVENQNVGHGTVRNYSMPLSMHSPNTYELGIITATPNLPELADPKPLPPPKIYAPANTPQFTAEVLSTGYLSTVQAEKTPDWWDIPEEQQKNTSNPNLQPYRMRDKSLDGGLKDSQKTNSGRNPSAKQCFEPAGPHFNPRQKGEQFGPDPRWLASESQVQYLYPQLPGQKMEAPKEAVPNPQHFETEHEYLMRLQREPKQIAEDMALAQQLSNELSAKTNNPRTAKHNKSANPMDRKVAESSGHKSALQDQKDRELAEKMAYSYDQSLDPDTLALLATLADGVPQDYVAFREQEAATEKLIAELTGGNCQDLDKLHKIHEQDRELAKKLADDSPQDPRELQRQLAEQEAFARKTQRMLEKEHRRHMEEEAAAARKAQEDWNMEIIKLEEEARRRAEELRREARKREARIRAEAAAAEQKRLAEEKAKAAREAEARKAKQAEERRRKERMATCLVCQDEGEKSNMAILSCTHAYCESCIKHAFTQALKDRTRFRCCSLVPMKSVQKHFEPRFVKEYNWLVLELETPNPLYCGMKSCSKFIPPSDIHGDIGTCRVCLRKTCKYCRSLQHKGICVEDKGAQAVRELARKKGWKPCPGCEHMIERNDGCLHMTCRQCKAEFCYSCGQRSSICSGTCQR